MSAQANVVAFDGASTPVSHTLVPVRSFEQNGVTQAEWREQLASVPVYANPRLTTKMEKLKSGVYRLQVRVEVPVMESISGQNSAGYTAAPKVAYTNTFDCVGYFSERSTQAERKLVRQLAINIAGNISTTVTPSSAGVVKELVDDLISAS